MNEKETDLFLYGQNSNDVSIRNACFRIPKKQIDGRWYGDLDVMSAMMRFLVRQAERRDDCPPLSCADFDAIVKRVLSKRS